MTEREVAFAMEIVRKWWRGEINTRAAEWQLGEQLTQEQIDRVMEVASRRYTSDETARILADAK